MSAIGYAALGIVGAALVVAAVAAAPVLAGVAAGTVIGAAAGGVMSVGGAIAIAGVGLSGAAQGIAAGRKDAASAPLGGGCSKIVVGSENVFIEGKAAARAGRDDNAHGPPKKLKTGSCTVSINKRPACRVEDGSTCGGKVIDGAKRTFIYGAPATEIGGAAVATTTTTASADGLDGVDWEAWESGLGMAGLALGLATGGVALAGVVRGAGGLRAAFMTQPGLTRVGVFGAQVGAGVVGGEAFSRAGGAMGGVAGAVMGEAVSNAIPAHRIGRSLTLPKVAPTNAAPHAPRALPQPEGVHVDGVEVLAPGDRGYSRGDHAKDITPRNADGSIAAEPIRQLPAPHRTTGLRTPDVPERGTGLRTQPDVSAPGGLGRRGMPQYGDKSFQSKVLDADTHVLKRVRDPSDVIQMDGSTTPYAGRAVVASRLAEVHNAVSQRLGSDVVKPLEPLIHEDGRPSAWVRQEKVHGVPISELSPSMQQQARQDLDGRIVQAREALGLTYEQPFRNENGITYRVDAVNVEANARVDPKTGKVSWFDPVTVESIDRDAMMAAANKPLLFGRPDPARFDHYLEGIGQPAHTMRQAHPRVTVVNPAALNDMVAAKAAAAPCAACQAGPTPAETRVAETAAKLAAPRQQQQQQQQQQGRPPVNRAQQEQQARWQAERTRANRKDRSPSLKGMSDEELRAGGSGYLSPKAAVSTVENAWQKVGRLEKQAGRPLSQEEQVRAFDGFMSRNLTELGPARVDRAGGHRLFVIDDPFLASANVPDHIKQRVTIDHHDPLFTTPKGPVETSAQQIVARATAQDPRLLADGNIYWTSGNVNDGLADGAVMLKNADKLAANPAQAKTAHEVSDWIDNKNFSKSVPLLDADIPAGSSTEKALAVMRLNDQLVQTIGTPAADRTAVPGPGGSIIDIVKPENVRPHLDAAHAKIESVLFDDSPAARAETSRLAQEQLGGIRSAQAGIAEGTVELGNYGAEPSGVLFVDSTKLANVPPLAKWRAVPEQTRSIEAARAAQGIDTPIVSKINFNEGKPDALGATSGYFIDGKSLDGLVPLISKAEIDARVKLLDSPSIKNDPAKVDQLQKEIAGLEKGGGVVKTKLPGLVFAAGGSRMSKTELIDFAKRPDVRAILEGRPPPGGAGAVPEPTTPCAACSAGGAPSAASTAQAAAGGGLAPKVLNSNGVALFVPKDLPPGVSPNPFARRVELTHARRFAYRLTASDIKKIFRVSTVEAESLAKLSDFQNLDVDAVGPGNARRIAHLQELEGRVQSRVERDGLPPHEALEAELREMERRHGFGEAADLTSALSDDEFYAILRRGQPIRDVAFAQGALENVFHGQQVHRIQWWAVARELEVNPNAFGNGQSAVDLYRMVGRATRRHHSGIGGSGISTELFDLGRRDAVLPASSIWQGHQISPAYTVFSDMEPAAGQLPGLYYADHPPGGATVDVSGDAPPPISSEQPAESPTRSFFGRVRRFFSTGS